MGVTERIFIVKPVKHYNDMKNNPFKYFVFLTLSMLMVTMAGCTEDDISMPAGQLPDETPMNSIGGQLRSGKTLSNKILVRLYEGDETATQDIYYTLTKPIPTTFTAKAVVDESLVNGYNENNKTKLKALPADNVHFEAEGVFTIESGKKLSAPIKVNISTEGLDFNETYLLPVTVTQIPKDIEAQVEKQTLYYGVNIRKKITTCNPGWGDIDIPVLLPNVLSVFYVNTDAYQPLIVSAWGVDRMDNIEWMDVYYSIGNIVNLKTSTVDYETTSQRVLFKPAYDLGYVLEHRDKYIRPLTEIGRKVCLCIENGGKGVGFCNMSDMQIADFVGQVKEVVERYQLDGVNLWDEDDKYGKPNMPALNTTSYPKLIKSLREAMPDKLLTLVDKGNATEYFYDVDKCGGIEVGRYIDYAWSGYCSPTEQVQIINPGKETNYSKYFRKQIAGLKEESYGSINYPMYPNNTNINLDKNNENITKWKMANMKKSDILVFGSNLIGNEYAEKENAARMMFDAFGGFMDDGWIWAEDPWGGEGAEMNPAMYMGFPLDPQVDSNPADNGYKKDW